MSRPASLQSSNRPWYYVPGKTYLSEQRLAAKHDAEAKKQFENERINKYFSKCKQEAKLFSNWEQNKHLVKYQNKTTKSSKTRSAPPFRIEDKDEIKVDQQIFDEYLKDIRQKFNNYHESAMNFRKSFIDSSAAVHYLIQQMDLYEEVKTKREHFFTNWQKYQKSTGVYCHNNDPLRQVCFLIRELLYFYKSTLSDNLKRLKDLYVNEFFTDEEKQELQELNDRCLQIIDMYLDLNETRDHHFQSMFYEERECHWSKQKCYWKQEIEVWDNLFVKLFDSNYLLIRNRIEEIMEKQRNLMKDRLTKLNQLKQFIEESSDNEKLRPILYFDIEQLKKS